MKNTTVKIVIALLLLTPLVGKSYDRVTYIHTDVLGTPIAASDENGTLEWRAQHLPFGAEFTNTEVRRSSEIGYTAKTLDEEIGLMYYGARHYDPVLGRFTSIDPAPIQAEDYRTFNRYAYAANNSYTYLDPDGRRFVLGAFVLGAFKLGASGISKAFAKIRSSLKRGAGEGSADDLVKSASRPARAGSQDSRALQALKKKIDRGDGAFSGLPKTQEAANSLIRKILNAKNPIIRSQDRNGKVVRDVFDPKTGRGVRTINGQFDTFVNLK